MSSSVEKNLLEYIKKTLIYIWIEELNLQTFQENYFSKKWKDYNFTENFINFSDYLKDTEIYNLYSENSIRSIIINLVSIFEYHLTELSQIKEIKKDKIFQKIQELEKLLNINLKDLLTEKLFYWIWEIIIRRNLYVHNHWIISHRYIQDLNKYTKEDTTNLVVWEKLEWISIIYIRKILITLVTTLTILSIIILEKEQEVKDDFLYMISKIISLSKNRDHLLYSIAMRLDKSIDITKYEKFCLQVFSDLTNKEVLFYKENNTKFSIYKVIYNLRIRLISKWISNENLIWYYCLMKSPNFKKLLEKEILNNNDEIFYHLISNKDIWSAFLENFDNYFKKVLEKKQKKINPQIVFWKILEEQSKWFLLINEFKYENNNIL